MLNNKEWTDEQVNEVCKSILKLVLSCTKAKETPEFVLYLPDVIFHELCKKLESCRFPYSPDWLVRWIETSRYKIHGAEILPCSFHKNTQKAFSVLCENNQSLLNKFNFTRLILADLKKEADAEKKSWDKKEQALQTKIQNLQLKIESLKLRLVKKGNKK